MIYLIILVLVSVTAARYDFTGGIKRHENFWYNFLLWVLIAVSGLRYKVGGDTFAYIDYFKEVPFIWQIKQSDIAQAQFEPLWVIFMSLSKSVVNDFAFFQILHAIFINVVVFRFFKQNSRFRFTAVLIYFLFSYIYFNMEIMRQSVSICIFLLAYPYLRKKQWLRFYSYIVVAFLFHTSALILCFFPLMQNIKLRPVTILILLSVFFVITFIPDQFKAILSLFIFDERLSAHFTRYSAFASNLNGMILNLSTVLILPAILIYWANKRYKSKLIFTEFYFVYFFLAIIVSAYVGFTRFITYLNPLMIIYFATLLNNIYRDKYYHLFKRLAVAGLITISFIPKIVYYFKDTSQIVAGTRQYNLWYPYSSILDKKEYGKREDLFYGYFELHSD